MTNTQGSLEDPYFVTVKGTELRKETYWKVTSNDWPTFYLRFVEIQDSSGGLGAVVQDYVSYTRVHPSLFDQDYVNLVIDPEELALAMLSIHG